MYQIPLKIRWDECQEGYELGIYSEEEIARMKACSPEAVSRRVQKWTKWTRVTEDTFLKALSETGNVMRACRAAGVSRSGAYKRLERDQIFAAKWRQATENAADVLEDAAWTRAVHGVEKYVLYKGRICKDGDVPIVERVYSDGLAQFLLKGLRPHKYADRSMNIDIPPDKIDQMIEAELAKLASNPDFLQTLENQGTTESGKQEMHTECTH